MKKIGLLMILWLVAMMSRASDFVTYVTEIIGTDYAQGRCCFTGTGEDLLVEIQRDNQESLTFKLFDRNLELFKQFTINGLQADEEAIKLWSESTDKEHCYVSRYFFNDDGKYEVAIGHGDDYHGFNNVRIINEDGELLGTLDFNWNGRYISVGTKHYLMVRREDYVGDDYLTFFAYYGINNQTGKPLEDNKYDVNHDGKVNVSDVTSLINKILGIQ